MKKYIFLDIDGVLNHQQYYEGDNHKIVGVEYPCSDIDPDKITLLNDLIEGTGSEVICSSTWRIGKTPQQIEDILVKRGFVYNILDNTPVLSYSTKDGSVPRGCEINAWIQKHTAYGEKIRYIILDDDSDMMLWQNNNYFRIDGYCGLTPNIVYRAKRYLNSEC